MILKYREIEDSAVALAKLCQVTMPFKISYRIGKLNHKIQSELNYFEKQRFLLVRKNGKIGDPRTNSYVVLPEKNDDFNAELEALRDKDVEIDFEPIALEDLKIESIQPEFLVPWVFV